MSHKHIRKHIHKIAPYSPGKPITEVQRELGLTDIIKLASNENPNGPSHKAVEAGAQVLREANMYPDGSCWNLRMELSRHLGVPEECLLFGNGSDEIIHMLGVTFLEPGDEVLTATPTFVQYVAAAKLNDVTAVTVPMQADLKYDLRAMAAHVNDRTKLVFIANPNNPTGTLVSTDELTQFIAGLPPRVTVVMDEAYYEYVDDPSYPQTIPMILQGARVVTMRTFSKAYALAGLRIGYAVMSAELASAINRIREPFNVNLVAQAAACAALADQEHIAKAVALNRKGLDYFGAECDRLGLPWIPSQANCMMINVKRDAREVFDRLLRKGVIVRSGEIFGLPTWIRVTTGTMEQNRRFVQSLEEVLT